MQLTMRDVGEMFKVSEGTVARWVRQQGLPAQRLAGQLRFNRVEVLDWGVGNRMTMDGVPLNVQRDFPSSASLAEAVDSGGVYYKVPGDNREAALASVVARLPLPEGFDRESLLRLFVAREELGSTAAGDGIAIPHVRHPIVLHVSRPAITLAYLSQPVDFGALDGKPVHVLFSIVSPTNRSHLQLLSRLSFALHDGKLRETVARQAPSEEILEGFRRVEAGMGAPLVVAGKVAQ